MVNPFTATGFDFASMTAAINLMPNLYGRINELDLMPFRGIATTSLMVEELNGTLHIIRSRPRGAPADSVIADKRKLRSFVVPHIPLEDVLLPDDYQNIRAFGQTSQLETQAGVMARKQQKMKNAIDQTIEYLRMGALKGIILDADGSTLYNLYTEFGITAKTVDFALDVSTTDVRGKCAEVIRHIEDNLRGERMTGVRALVSATFFDALVSHANVKEAFSQYNVLNQNLANDYRRSFVFGGITFEEYRGTWTDKDGNARAAITANEGHVFPEGTGETFETVVSPGNFMETANMIGLPYYSKQEPRKFNAGIDLWAESNPLPICKRPGVLVKITI